MIVSLSATQVDLINNIIIVDDNSLEDLFMNTKNFVTCKRKDLFMNLKYSEKIDDTFAKRLYTIGVCYVNAIPSTEMLASSSLNQSLIGKAP